MHSLSFKVVADFRVVKNRPGSTRLGLRLADVDKKQWLNCRDNNLKRCRVVACTSEGSNSGASDSPIPAGSTQSQNQSSFLSRSQTYALLKQQLEVASKSEDYEEAARLRDSLKLFEDEEPVLRLKRRLKEAIDDERFEDAARYRDELKEVAPHSLLKCTSDATTLEGDYEMKHIDRVGSRTFNVAIAPFSLSTFGDGTDNLSDQELWKL
nr:uncharacterized protein LOC109177197 [Ipomoea trifida]